MYKNDASAYNRHAMKALYTKRKKAIVLLFGFLVLNATWLASHLRLVKEGRHGTICTFVFGPKERPPRRLPRTKKQYKK